MPVGTVTLDFGAFPGASDAAVVVTGQAGIVSGSRVEAWLRIADTADHSADEHVVETIKVAAGTIVAGVGFTVQGVNTGTLSEPLTRPGAGFTVGGRAAEVGASIGGMGTRLYGTWLVDWVWL